MSINFKNALGIHPDALNVRSQRAEILANNLANSDTPGFKAQDLDFKGILNGEHESRQRMELETTQQGHISGFAETGESMLKYRVPSQPAIDGNTVDAQIEQAQYARNALQFQSSFTFLNGKFQGLTKAIKGE